MAKLPFVRDSVEYYRFSISDATGQDLTSNVVQVAIEVPHTDSPTWIDCTWDTGTIWRTNDPITWSAANYPAVSTGYEGWAKIVDSPETPWVYLGPVTIRER